MKNKILFLAFVFVFTTSITAFAGEEWSNISGAIINPEESTTISKISSDFRVSVGVLLVADSTVSDYGVAAGHVVSGTRIYHSHSNNAQIEVADMADPKALEAAKRTEIEGLSADALVDAQSGS